MNDLFPTKLHREFRDFLMRMIGTAPVGTTIEMLVATPGCEPMTLTAKFPEEEA